MPALGATGQMSVTGWYYLSIPASNGGAPFSYDSTYPQLSMWIDGSCGGNYMLVWLLQGNNMYTDHCLGTKAVPTNTWIFFAMTFQGGAPITVIEYMYVGGTSYSGGFGVTPPNTVNPAQLLMIGQPYLVPIISSNGEPWVGEIADVQVYNTTLDANSITAIYQEGIGGVPINLQGLVAWLPLNGNANDYSRGHQQRADCQCCLHEPVARRIHYPIASNGTTVLYPPIELYS